MPLPLIPIVVGLACALAGGVIVWVITINWDAIVIWWKGKTLAVLGANETGKTTLIDFLTAGEVPERYDPTSATQPTKGNRYELKDLCLSLKESRDVPGNPHAADQWKTTVQGADILIYLVNAAKLLEGDRQTTSRIERDTKMIRGWLAKTPKSMGCMIIGTWADKIPGYREMDGKAMSDLANRFGQNPSVRSAVRSLRTEQTPEIPVFLGSLERLPDMQRLVMLALKEFAD